MHKCSACSEGELLSPEVVERGRRDVRHMLEEQAREEERAAKNTSCGMALAALDDELAALHTKGLRPAALQAGIA